jgi:hypothetical protein
VRRILIISLLAGSVTAAQAEPRWCSIAGKAIADKASYPPIAKAARVEGVVVSRIIFQPSGKVAGFEQVFGPAMLAKSLEQQTASWILANDAKGDDLCETLIVARFRFKEPASCDPRPDVPTENDFSTPGILRLDLSAYPYLICDPASTVTSSNPARLLFYKLKRGLRRLVHGREPLEPML